MQSVDIWQSIQNKKIVESLCRNAEIAYSIGMEKTDINGLLIKRLTPLQYKCYIRYIQGDKQRDIARMLGISQPTVSQHIKYAVKKVKNLSFDTYKSTNYRKDYDRA